MNWALLLLALWGGECCYGGGQVQGEFPRVGNYSLMPGSGAPFVVGGVIDTAKCREQAKYDHIIIDVMPLTSTLNRDALRLIRQFNPRANILAYISAGTLWMCTAGWAWWKDPVVGCDSVNLSHTWMRNRIVRKYNGIIRSYTRDYDGDSLKDQWSDTPLGQDGRYKTPQVNWAITGLPEEMADSMSAWVLADPGVFNGYFGDETSQKTFLYSDTADFTISGHADQNAWKTAWEAGATAYWNRMASNLAGKLVCGNTGSYGPRTINGWMRENFPIQNGGTWSSNMFGWSAHSGADVGFFGDDSAYARKPVRNVLNGLCDTPGSCVQTSLENQRRHRWFLGSATLTDYTVAHIGGYSPSEYRGPMLWWADEFAVTPGGESSPDVRYKGWLGRPLGKWYNEAGRYRRDFEGGSVLVNHLTSSATFTNFPGPWRWFKIKGTVCPSVNTGAEIFNGTGVSVPAEDALFIQRRR